MPEIKTEVKTYEVDYRCPRCSEGFLRHAGPILTSYPPQYPHICNNPDCDYHETFNRNYPYLVTEIIEDNGNQD